MLNIQSNPIDNGVLGDTSCRVGWEYFVEADFQRDFLYPVPIAGLQGLGLFGIK